MKNNPFLIALASALVTVVAIRAAPALAEPSATNVSLVRTADLDLGNGKDLRTLDRRLATAAREVCGTASDVDIAGKNEVRRCRDETLARARDRAGELQVASAPSTVIAVTAAR